MITAPANRLAENVGDAAVRLIHGLSDLAVGTRTACSPDDRVKSGTCGHDQATTSCCLISSLITHKSEV